MMQTIFFFFILRKKKLKDFGKRCSCQYIFITIPQMHFIEGFKPEMCKIIDYSLLDQYLRSKMHLTVETDKIMDVLCNSSSSQWFEQLDRIGLSRIQAVVLFDVVGISFFISNISE